MGGSDFDATARHVPALRLVFARFDRRQIGQRLPPAAPRARRSSRKSVHWTDLTPPGQGRVLLRQARPDLPAIGVRHLPCLPPCGFQQSGRAFPHRGTACPTLGPRHGDRGVGVKVRKPFPSNPEPLWQLRRTLRGEYLEKAEMATPGGIEPPTSDLEGPCSIQLSYGAAFRCFAAWLGFMQVCVS